VPATPLREEANEQEKDEHFLLRAFHSFSAAATSLERSYGQLRDEVERLRRELERSRAGLAQSLEENRNMRTHLDRILEGLPCGVLVISESGKISRANPEALRLLEVEDRGCIAAPGPVSSLPDAILELLRRARSHPGEQERDLGPQRGRRRWLAVRHASVADGAGSSSVFILRDVSERKRLEEAASRMRREQALAEMSAVLAHEIRNPLGSLELFAGLLAESGVGEDSRKWVEHLQAGLRTLSATVNNVLHFHSLPEPERTPVDLGQLLDWAAEFFLPLARQARVELSLHNGLRGVSLGGDRHRLEQVLQNLVLNGVRAMPGGGWIEIGGRLTPEGKSAAIVVADTGPGIDPETLPLIFEPGFSTRAGSPGLGLAVSRKIIEQHGGTITAASRAGGGAAFRLTFPLAGGPNIERSPEIPETKGAAA
jgi:PAS domain S-box-containing protein